MTTNTSLQLVLVAAFVGACDEGPAPDTEEREAVAPTPTMEIEATDFEDHGVRLELRLRRQSCHERVNHGMSGGATATDEAMRVGDRGTALVWGGKFVAGRWSPAEGIASYGAADGTLAAHQPAPHEWTIDAKRLPSTRPEEYRFELTWEHRVVQNEDATPRATGDTRVVALGDDDHHVLDWLVLPRDESGCDRSLIIDVIAVREEPEQLRDRTLRYDVWYVHTLPDGTEITSHSETNALHGRAVDFSLPVVRPPLSSPLFDGDAALEVVIVPRGALRGRLRTDGAIDLVVDAQLRRGLVPVGEPISGWVADRGTHAFRLAPGQTLRLELPAAGGSWTWTGTDGDRIVPGAEALRDHSDALLVTVELD